MCLAIPGKVIEISTSAAGVKMARVSFSGTIREVCLECVPDTVVDDFVIVHTGFAVSRLTEEEATQIIDTIEEMERAAQSDVAAPQ
jgi:hydrogenase expression/formation protein HypC